MTRADGGKTRDRHASRSLIAGMNVSTTYASTEDAVRERIRHILLPYVLEHLRYVLRWRNACD